VNAESECVPGTGQPVGLPVDTRPAKWPEVVTLAGRYGRVEKFLARHSEPLWRQVQGHDALWTYMNGGPFEDYAAFSDWTASRVTSDITCSYAIVTPEGAPLGVMSLMEIRPEARVIEVGSVLYSPALQRTPLGTEAQYLLARHVFETLGYRRHEWKCNALNAPSRAAALRYGFTFEGILRSHMIAKGRNRDTAYFSMLESEWPSRRAALEQWLAPENFDAGGRQKKRLEELRT
jgi:RimJ/RimL family protein N-acetyltransferase